MTFEAQLRAAANASDEEARHTFESEHSMWFGFRAQPGAVAEEVAACLDSRYDERGLSVDVTASGLSLRFGSREAQVPKQRYYRQCYAELRALNQILAPDYEIRLVADSVDEPAHGFVIASSREWRAAAARPHGLDAIYAPITRRTDFALGPAPAISIWFAERAVGLLIRFLFGRRG